MDRIRKLTMIAATVAVALGAGHVMQNGLQFGKTAKVANADPKPKAITPLAAGLGVENPSSLPVIPADPVAPALPETAMTPTAPQAPIAALSGDTTNCPVNLDVLAAPQAMIDVSLLAPCRAGERVVLRHGGLAVTTRTTLAGTVFVSVPGMERDGAVSVLFADGTEVLASVDLPDLPIYQRFAVQWLANDTFQLNAFEGRAAFGEPGHVSAANPQRRVAGLPSKGGYLTILGDDTVDLPMLAEVYTFPTDPTLSVDITIEAEVTAATCDRELLGELLQSTAGQVTSTELTLATPTCDAIGDVLVLNNPLTDLKLAESN